MERSDFQDVLLAIVGGYLIYLAYQLFTGLPTVETRRMFIVMVIASVVFAGVGIFVIIRSIHFIWKKHRNNPDVNDTDVNNIDVNNDISSDDKNSTD